MGNEKKNTTIKIKYKIQNNNRIHLHTKNWHKNNFQKKKAQTKRNETTATTTDSIFSVASSASPTYGNLFFSSYSIIPISTHLSISIIKYTNKKTKNN